MLGSKSKYFHQSKPILIEGHKKMVRYLVDMNYSIMQIGVYEKAYEYFCDNPTKFDGATIVKDLYHIPGLDLNAMLHDYQYLVYNVSASLKMKRKCDWLYAKEMEKTGKGQLSWVNWLGLKITGIPFIIYTLIKRGKVTRLQRKRFETDYFIMMKT